ncbi:hypothetical protein [Gilvibacter sp.]|uniref:hypothetical protein n=1 Tax=Gilvibacter sp. TaxID=2729997 RepID=UPI003B522403
MSKEKLSEIVNSPTSELNKLKIGFLVRATLPIVLEHELISEIEVKKLTQDDYSKMIFDMNYPVLKLINEDQSIIENRSVGDYTRYYADPHNYKDSRYLISSEWYDRNQEDYIRWLKRKISL